jgi:hypothetical protein
MGSDLDFQGAAPFDKGRPERFLDLGQGGFAPPFVGRGDDRLACDHQSGGGITDVQNGCDIVVAHRNLLFAIDLLPAWQTKPLLAAEC